MVNDGNFILGQLNIQLNHVRPLFESVIERIHRILEHLFTSISPSGNASSAMANIETILFQLPASRVSCAELDFEIIGQVTLIGFGNEILGCGEDEQS